MVHATLNYSGNASPEFGIALLVSSQGFKTFVIDLVFILFRCGLRFKVAIRRFIFGLKFGWKINTKSCRQQVHLNIDPEL